MGFNSTCILAMKRASITFHLMPTKHHLWFRTINSQYLALFLPLNWIHIYRAFSSAQTFLVFFYPKYKTIRTTARPRWSFVICAHAQWWRHYSIALEFSLAMLLHTLSQNCNNLKRAYLSKHGTNPIKLLLACTSIQFKDQCLVEWEQYSYMPDCSCMGSWPIHCPYSNTGISLHAAVSVHEPSKGIDQVIIRYARIHVWGFAREFRQQCNTCHYWASSESNWCVLVCTWLCTNIILNESKNVLGQAPACSCYLWEQ